MNVKQNQTTHLARGDLQKQISKYNRLFYSKISGTNQNNSGFY
jgi:hypothetical protein